MAELEQEWRWRDGNTKVVHRLTARLTAERDRWGWSPVCGAPRKSRKRSQCAAKVDCLECIARSE